MSYVWSRAAWDTLFASAYNRTASVLIAGPYASLTKTLRTDSGMALAALPPGSVLLDAGCGPGHVTVRLARDAPQATVIGLDFSATMLGLGAVTLAASKASNWRLIQADSHHLPFVDGRADLVLSTGALKNWVDPVACVNERYWVAKPHATVVLAEVNRDATRADKDAWKRHLETALPRRPMVGAYGRGSSRISFSGPASARLTWRRWPGRPAVGISIWLPSGVIPSSSHL